MDSTRFSFHHRDLKMKSTPDPAFSFVTSIHTDVPKTFDRVQQARRDEAKTGLATGAIRANLAESFRQQKLALGGPPSPTAGSVVDAPDTVRRNAP
jgi:hypothetical protein